ncbi:hypothetical protein BJ508DRAFT_88271 [Ascobolus immersus RN42]|uniref:Uncharacterized protein n=1 Tax=Ascobolus immersus RN42 TaxID=1160509 RepID=A0A3N4HHY0_ASCIM|nr:hypothetical protein BJ508DRAFT_88271 [Ascobolus immersus RN42]
MKKSCRSQSPWGSPKSRTTNSRLGSAIIRRPWNFWNPGSKTKNPRNEDTGTHWNHPDDQQSQTFPNFLPISTRKKTPKSNKPSYNLSNATPEKDSKQQLPKMATNSFAITDEALHLLGGNYPYTSENAAFLLRVLKHTHKGMVPTHLTLCTM